MKMFATSGFSPTATDGTSKLPKSNQRKCFRSFMKAAVSIVMAKDPRQLGAFLQQTILLPAPGQIRETLRAAGPRQLLTLVGSRNSDGRQRLMLSVAKQIERR